MTAESHMLTPDMWVAVGIMLVTYLFIFSEALPRTSAGIIGAVIMIGIGSALGFYSQQAAIEAIDGNTLMLLLAMMILVAMLRPTGGFEYLAIRLAKLAGGDPRLLLVYLCFAVTVLSMFLDNVTTVLIFAPITVLITRMLNLNPVPFLIAEAMLSNIGGAVTLVGDPPNIMIGSAANLNFTEFITNMGPMILPAWIGTLILFMFLFKKELRPAHGSGHGVDLDESKAIHDMADLRRLSMALLLVIVLFFFHHRLNLFPAYIAWIGVAVALLLARPDPEALFPDVVWSVLLFFASLFVIVGGVKASGVLDLVGHLLASSTAQPETLLWSALILMWGAAILSALVDNIPFTITMIPIITALEGQGINVQPFWWALAIGVGLGGNATHIGATANIICITEAEHSRHPAAKITPLQWLRIGIPVMLFSLTAASMLFVVLFEWISI
jgi:Na+/H+ antiporter NhaD/arsenite permease-like protein